MRLAVFGGTDKTGRWLLGKALASGLEVVVLAPAPGRVGLFHEHLEIVAGNALNAAVVDRVVAGADAVISLLHPAARPAPLAVSQSTANIIAAMETHGVRRLLAIIDSDVTDPQDQLTWRDRLAIGAKRLVASDLLADAWATAAQVQASDLDWTLVRVPRLIDDLNQNPARAGMRDKRSGRTLERSALAEFLLRQLDRDDYLHQAPLLTH